MGAYAEYLAVKPAAIARKPSNLSFEEAASVPVASQTEPVDRRTKVVLFEQIRREYEHVGNDPRNRQKLGIHRRIVREAVLSAVPVERKIPARERPKLEPAKAFVEAILEADRKAPRKQRHTTHRIWCRIRAEMPSRSFAVGNL
jgi:pyruvate/2-oxoglutarate dehydrogenase complex dihydrolipoamide acyltransferase (E2) component